MGSSRVCCRGWGRNGRRCRRGATWISPGSTRRAGHVSRRAPPRARRSAHRPVVGRVVGVLGTLWLSLRIQSGCACVHKQFTHIKHTHPSPVFSHRERCPPPERVRWHEEGHGADRQIHVRLAPEPRARELAQRHRAAELPRRAEGLSLVCGVCCGGLGWVRVCVWMGQPKTRV